MYVPVQSVILHVIVVHDFFLCLDYVPNVIQITILSINNSIHSSSTFSI